jgi:DNA helicase-2/ATP-dependent DNA helicase PcrA
LVDEYQDINQAQCDLIQLLTEGQTKGLFAVGDDDQSIYSFRGGSPEYIRNFEYYYGKKAKIGRLYKSWRCPEHILKGAHAMVKEHYTESALKPKPTFSKKIRINNKIQIWDVPSDNREAEIIARIAKNNIASDSVIVIIPNLNYLPPIKKALKHAGLDYKYKFNINEEGLIRFSVLSNWVEDQNDNLIMRYLLDLIINNYDELTKKIDTPTKKITEKREKASELIASFWRNVNNQRSLYDVICNKGEEAKKDSYLAHLKDSLDDIHKLLKEKGSSRHKHHEFLEKTGLLLAPGKNPKGIILEIKEWMNELIESNRGSSLAPVKIYNMPSSKGLQGKIICVVGVSEGIIPHPDDDVEEKCRLFYVAMTRAKKELHLFSARKRLGSVTYKKVSYQLKKSPYIKSIPKQHIDEKYIRA